MSVDSLRSRVRTALRAKDDRLLTEEGFTYESGALTKEGRMVVADLQLDGVSNEDLKSRLVEIAKKLRGEEEKKRK